MSFSNILSTFGFKKVVKLFEAQGMPTDEAQKMATVLATEEYLLEDGRAIEYDLDTKKALIVMAGGLKCPIPSGSIKLSDGTSIDVVAHTPEEIAAVVGKVEVEASTYATIYDGNMCARSMPHPRLHDMLVQCSILYWLV